MTTAQQSAPAVGGGAPEDNCVAGRTTVHSVPPPAPETWRDLTQTSIDGDPFAAQKFVMAEMARLEKDFYATNSTDVLTEYGELCGAVLDSSGAVEATSQLLRWHPSRPNREVLESYEATVFDAVDRGMRFRRDIPGLDACRARRAEKTAQVRKARLKTEQLDLIEAKEAAQREHERRQTGEEISDDPEESLHPVDLGPYLRGEVEKPSPSVGMARTDGLCLLYPGKEHSVIGEMESGKTWYCLASAAAELLKGCHVAYYHFEESDPSGTIERLALLGVGADVVAERFHFIAPAVPVTPASVAKVRALNPSLVILDGKNEAMHLHGLGIRDEDGAAGYRRRLVKPFTRDGATVLSCDHVTKDKETRGRNSIGSQHKDAGVDGTLIMLETKSPFGRNVCGRSSVFITKDRPGFLRQHGEAVQKIAGKTFMGTLIVDDTEEGRKAHDLSPFVKGSVERPRVEYLPVKRDKQEEDAPAQDCDSFAEYDGKVLHAVTELYAENREAVSTRTIRVKVGGRSEKVADALERLRQAKRLTGSQKGSAKLWAPVPEGGNQ